MSSVSAGTYYRDHWMDVDPERVETYEEMFRWRPEMAPLLEPAGIEPGHTVVDYGCGPGMLSLELARRVGPNGRVHGVDINPLFVERAGKNARAASLEARTDFHCADGSHIPLEDACANRLVCKNVLEYVDDPDETLCEFRRVLRPGGRAHLLDSDWGMLAVEPLGAERLAQLFDAASIAYRTPRIGRQLYGRMRTAGFRDVRVQVLARPDTTGRSAPVLFHMAKYAKDSGRLASAKIDALVDDVRQAIEAGTYFFVLPQFIATGEA